MAIAVHVRDYLSDLAALDQLKACLDEHPNSPIAPLIKKYIKFSMKAIALRRDIRADLIGGLLHKGTKEFDERYREEVLPLVTKLNRVIDKIYEMCGDHEDSDDLTLDADWWKKGIDD